MNVTTLAPSACGAPATAKRVTTLRPNYNITQDGDAYVVNVALPGVPRDHVTITLEEKSLRIEGRRDALAEDGWKPTYREIPQADFQLTLELNLAVAEDKITATTENGLLRLTLPVAEAAKARSITVE